MRLLVTGLILAAGLCAFAHPPVSVVIDARGNVYYSDLAQVWRVAPDGTKQIVVPGVHTHELYLDAQGNLFGAESRFPWSPSGGAFAPNGDLWLLETSITNSVRVRKIAARR